MNSRQNSVVHLIRGRRVSSFILDALFLSSAVCAIIVDTLVVPSFSAASYSIARSAYVYTAKPKQ